MENSYLQASIKNADILQRLENEVGADVLQQLLIIFIEETTDLFAKLAPLLTVDTSVEATRIAHSIKSGAKSYGADRLAEIAAHIEGLLRDNKCEEVKSCMTDLETVFDATVKQYT